MIDIDYYLNWQMFENHLISMKFELRYQYDLWWIQLKDNVLHVLFKTVYYFIIVNGQGRVQYSGVYEIEFKRIQLKYNISNGRN